MRPTLFKQDTALFDLLYNNNTNLTFVKLNFFVLFYFSFTLSENVNFGLTETPTSRLSSLFSLKLFSTKNQRPHIAKEILLNYFLNLKPNALILKLLEKIYSANYHIEVINRSY